MRSDKEVIKLFEKQKNITKRGLSTQWDNTRLCLSFYNDDAMSYSDRIQFADDNGRRRRATVNFNKVKENVDAVVGFMAQNRRQAKYVARVNGSDKQQLYSKNMNALYSYHRENMNADQIETDQDADMMINGYGAIETDLSYIVGNATTMPGGEVIKHRLDPLRVGWDPNAKAKNLADKRWVYYFEDFDLQEALDLFQGSKKDDFATVSDEDLDSNKGYVYNPWGGLYDQIKALDAVEWVSKDNDTVRVYNYQWMEYETFYRAYNPLYLVEDPLDAQFIKVKLDAMKASIKASGIIGINSKDAFDFDPLAEELVLDESLKRMFVKEFGDLIEPIAFKRKCFYTAVISGDHVFSKFKSISQQGFSVKFKTGVYNDSGNFWTGMVNSMAEPQKYYNKALTELMFTIAANSKGGVMVEEGAVEDIADFESKWAKTDAVIKVAVGALSGGQIQEKARAAVPTGLENIITLSASQISSAGVDPAFLGNLQDEQSGVLYKRRIRQVISKMARYFDSITLYQKEDARLCLDLIRVWVENNSGEMVRITGEDGADEFKMINEDMLAPLYDVAIQEAPQTPEDKTETADFLNNMSTKYATVGDINTAKAIDAESIKYRSLDGEAKNNLVRLLQPQDQQQIDPAYVKQLEEAIQKLTSAQAQAEVAKKEAETRYADARAAQTMANIEATKAKAPLTQAQTIKTLEEAKRTSEEVDLAQSAPKEGVQVSI